MANQSDTLSAKVNRDGLKLESGDRSIQLDLEGRWCSYRWATDFYRRCVDGEVIRYQNRAITIGAAEASLLLDDIHRYICTVLDLCDQPDRWQFTGNWDLLRAVLKNSLKRGGESYQQDRQLFQQVYPERPPILPPDRYRDLVIQPAIGCPNRKCTFCAFYKDKPFKALNAAAVEEHIAGLRQLFGKAIYSRNGIFLGSANAMALSQRRLTAALDLIDSEIGLPQRGIASFHDSYYAPKRTHKEWQELQQRGLTRLIIGLESGSQTLRQQLGKSPDLTILRNDLREIKQAGIHLGITVLVGAGGEQMSPEHLHETLNFFKELTLDREDFIYLSPLEMEDNSPGELLINQQLDAFKLGIREHLNAKAVPYQMGRYRYYC